MPSLTETFITQTIEMLLNEAIARDERSKSLLKRLENKSFEFFVTDIQKSISLIFLESKITIRSARSCESGQLPDVMISASFLNFIDLLLTSDKTKKIVSKKFELNGDANLASQLNSVIEKIDFRWDDLVSLVAGDIVTSQVVKKTAKINKFQSESLKRIATNFDDFLSEELKFTPNENRMEALGESIDEIRLKLDRIEAKVLHISRKLQSKNSLTTTSVVTATR